MNEEYKYQTPYAPVIPGKPLFSLKVGDWKFQKPEVDKAKCTKCGLCWLYCPTQTIYEAETHYEVDLDWCKGCGICANECPVEAIAMVAL